MSASQYDVDRKTMSLVGPAPADDTRARRWSTRPSPASSTGASDAVARSQAASETAGQTVTERNDLGDQAYAPSTDVGAELPAACATTGSSCTSPGPDASATEVDEVASAFDKALGGDGGTVSRGDAVAGDLGPSVRDPGRIESTRVERRRVRREPGAAGARSRRCRRRWATSP